MLFNLLLKTPQVKFAGLRENHTNMIRNLRQPVSPPQDRQGAVLVENALVISVFLVFLFGIIEFGHVYLVINTLNAAAKRAAAVAGS